MNLGLNLWMVKVTCTLVYQIASEQSRYSYVLDVIFTEEGYFVSAGERDCAGDFAGSCSGTEPSRLGEERQLDGVICLSLPI